MSLECHYTCVLAFSGGNTTQVRTEPDGLLVAAHQFILDQPDAARRAFLKGQGTLSVTPQPSLSGPYPDYDAGHWRKLFRLYGRNCKW